MATERAEASPYHGTDTMRAVLGRLLDVDGIECALVASPDGLLIDGLGEPSDLDSIAAIGTYAMRAVQRMSDLREKLQPTRVTVASRQDTILLHAISEEGVLIVLLTDHVNLRYVQFLLDRYHKDLRTAVSIRSNGS